MSRPSMTTPPRPARAALLLHQHVANAGHHGHARSRLRNRERAQARGDVFAIHNDPQLAARGRQVDARVARQAFQFSRAIEGHAVAQRFPAHGAVHRSAIQVRVAEQIGRAPRHRAFSRAHRSVNGDD